MLHSTASSSSLRDNKSNDTGMSTDNQRLRPQVSAPALTASYSNGRPSLRVTLAEDNTSAVPGTDDGSSPGRRQRRRVGTEDNSYRGHDYGHSTSSTTNSASSNIRGSSPGHPSGYGHESHDPYSSISPVGLRRRWSVSSNDSLSSASEDELTGAVGQLSLNEDEQVRYHGKASGLHLLGNKERVDGRNEGGIWCALLLVDDFSLTVQFSNEQAFPKSTGVASSAIVGLSRHEWRRRICAPATECARTRTPFRPLLQIRAPYPPSRAQTGLL